MAAYKQRCSDVFGSLSLPQGSSLRQPSSLNPEDRYLSSTGSKEDTIRVSHPVLEGGSGTAPHCSADDFIDEQAMAVVHSGFRRNSPEGGSEGRRRYGHSRDRREDDQRDAIVHSGDRRESTRQGRRGEGGRRDRGGGGKRHQGRGHRATPDYVVHPQHWTKYDLNDDEASDSVGDMSEEQRNTFAALQFLEDLRARNRGEQGRNVEELDEDKSASDGVVFRKPVAPSTLKTTGGEMEAVKGTWNHARILPEYQVGSKIVRKRKPITSSVTPFEEEEEESVPSHDSSCDGMQLGHLCEMSEGAGEEQSYGQDSHMSSGKDPEQVVRDVDGVCNSSISHEPLEVGGPPVPPHCEGEQLEGKVLFKKSGKKKKQGQRRVVDAELD